MTKKKNEIPVKFEPQPQACVVPVHEQLIRRDVRLTPTPPFWPLVQPHLPASLPPQFVDWVRLENHGTVDQGPIRKMEPGRSALLDNAMDAIIGVDGNWVVREWNRAAERIFGYGFGEALNRPVADLIAPDPVHESFKDRLTSGLASGGTRRVSCPVETTLRRLGGSEFRAEMAIACVPLESALRCRVLIRDLTQPQTSAVTARPGPVGWSRMVEQVSALAIYALDADGRVVRWNCGAERMQQFKTEEVLESPVASFFTTEDVAQGLPQRLLEQARTAGEAYYEGWQMRKDGSRAWVKGALTALRDEPGHAGGFLVMVQDMTDAKRMDEVIWNLNTRLEQRLLQRTMDWESTTQELESFVAAISDEIRIPSRQVIAHGEILLESADAVLGSVEKEHLQALIDAASRLDHLTDTLAALTRASTAELRETRVDLRSVVEEVWCDLRFDLEGRRIEWRISPLPEVDGDPILLRQVIHHLLSNAVEFTRTREQATIEVGSLRRQHETVVFVRDNGVGFDMKLSGRLFKALQRLHPRGEFEGAGLGLAIVRRIVQRLGGRVWAEGTVDGGATFFFSLPSLMKAV